jgi:hypothetical protein
MANIYDTDSFLFRRRVRRKRGNQSNPFLRSGTVLRQNTYRPEPKKVNPIEQQEINKPEVQADKDTKLRHEPILRKEGSVLPKKGSVMPDIKILPKRAPVLPISQKTRQRRGKIRRLVNNVEDDEAQEESVNDAEVEEFVKTAEGEKIRAAVFNEIKKELKEAGKEESEKDSSRMVLQRLKSLAKVQAGVKAMRRETAETQVFKNVINKDVHDFLEVSNDIEGGTRTELEDMLDVVKGVQNHKGVKEIIVKETKGNN